MRWKLARCWRRARFSTTRSAWGAEGGAQRSKEVHAQGGDGWIMHDVGGRCPLIVATIGKQPVRMTTWRGTGVECVSW